LYTGQIAGVCFTHVALSVLFIIYSQRIPRELFHNLTDFSNTLSCHDAIEAISEALRKKPKFVLDADISKCFYKINHKALLD
jgi:retron-type reverse transcriptase